MQLGAGIEVVGVLRMDVGREQVEHAHLVPLVEQRIDDVGADEAGAAGDEDPHRPGTVCPDGPAFQRLDEREFREP